LINLNELTAYLDRLLQVSDFHDAAPNGLQVEGRPQVKRIASGVTASLEFLQAAASWKADAVLVHHGYFWKGESPCIDGMKKQRLRLLLGEDMSLLAYHLPLDVHPRYGNNAQLARLLDLHVDGYLECTDVPSLVMTGHLDSPVSAEQFGSRIERCLGRRPQHICAGERRIRKLAWCSGAAQDYIECAASAGVDGYLSGEISERTVYAARELGVHYFAAGHHATERYGCRALGEHVAQHFGIDHRHIDIDNPV